MTRPLRPARLLAAALLAVVCGGPPATATENDSTAIVVPLHHELAVRLEPGTREIAGTDEIRLESEGAVTFRLAPGFRVERLTVDGTPWPAEPRNGAWSLALGEGTEHRIAVVYRGVLDPLPKEGEPAWDRRFAMGEEGGYLLGGAGWYPEFDAPSLTYRLTVDVPEGWRAVAPGRLTEEATAGGRARARFTAERPAEGIALFAGPYEVAERFHGEVRLRTYFTPGMADLSGPYLDEALRHLTRFERWIGAYPYPAFHVVAAPVAVGLGFPGIAYVGARVLRLPFIRKTSLAHEILHGWWGHGVAVEPGSGNWAEGLTTYMADYGVAEREGPAAAREMRLAWLRDYAALPASREVPLAAFTAKRHDADQVIGYRKAAFVFHMLKGELGKEAFDEGVRLFWRRHRHGRAGWDDLEAAFAEAAGRDLASFFRQWTTRAGAPRLALATARASRDGDGYRVDFTVTQEEPLYRLGLPVLLRTAAGERRSVVHLEGKEARATLFAEAPPLSLDIDPDFDVFRRLAEVEAPPILRDVTLAPDAVAVIAAPDAKAAAAARGLAERLLGGNHPTLEAAGPVPLETPLLVVGTGEEVEGFLERSGLPRMPAALSGGGTARVWTARTGIATLLAVAGRDAAALSALLRPLPHYGGKSFLRFEGSRAVEHGMWPAGEGPLHAAFPKTLPE